MRRNLSYLIIGLAMGLLIAGGIAWAQATTGKSALWSYTLTPVPIDTRGQIGGFVRYVDEEHGVICYAMAGKSRPELGAPSGIVENLSCVKVR